MKVNWFYIKVFVLVGVVLFLFGFAKNRNEAREIVDTKVNFEGDANLFITADTVDKLLIQKKVGDTAQGKEILVLSELEAKLDANAMIAEADVYRTIDGIIGANVKQRKPLARVNGEAPFYIDELGEAMPLSPNYSARVPVIEGLARENMQEVMPLLQYIKNDELLNEQVVGIKRTPSGNYRLSTRVLDYVIKMGKVKELDSKFSLRRLRRAKPGRYASKSAI